MNASAEDEIIFCNNPADRLAHLYTSNNHTNDSKQCTSRNESEVVQHQQGNVILFVSQLEPVCNIKTWIDAGAQIERVVKDHDGYLGDY